MTEDHGFLDSGEDPRRVEDEFYQETIIPLLEKETGLEHPENYEIWMYDSGQQMLHDQKSNCTSVDTENILGNLTEFYRRKKQEHVSEDVLGVANPNGPPYQLCISRSNIESSSADTEMLENYTKTHEGVHLIQYNNLDLENIPIENYGMIIEGHAEFITDKIFREHFNWERPEENYSASEKLLRKFYGLDAERDKYEAGSELFEEIHELGGTEAMALALENPPEGEEIHGPEKWWFKHSALAR